MAEDTKYVRGVNKLSQRIKTIRAKLNLPPMIEELGELVLRRTLDSFDKAQDPNGNPWPELKPATALRRRTGPLNVDGRLRAAIQLIKGSNTGGFATNTGVGIRIGVSDPSQVEKARYQNYGTKTIPARRFLGIGESDVKSVDAFLRRKGKEALNG